MSTSGLKSQVSSLPDDVVLSVRGVSKKFCRNLRRSMLYGIQDLTRSMLGIQSKLEFGNLKPESGSETQVSGLSPQHFPLTQVSSFKSHPSLPTPPSGLIPHPSDDSGLRSHPSALRKDEFWALRDINFELKRGECLGLIGLNGSGKSTLLRLLTGIFPPDDGTITVRGQTGALIALGAGFHPHLTGRENIYLNGSILGLSQAEIDRNFDSIVDFAEVGEFIEAPVATYSSGMRVRLGFAVATAQSPALLLIDEVLAVGDLQFTLKCLNRMREILRKTAVIFVSHSMEFVSLISTQVMVLQHGQVICHEQDPGKGIDFYYRQFAVQRQQKVQAATGIEFLRARLVDPPPSGDIPPVLLHGGSLTLEFEVALHQSVTQLALGVFIHGKEQRELVDAPSTLNDIYFDLPAGRHVFQVRLRDLHLNEGMHSLTILAFDKGGSNFQLRVDNVASFQIPHTVTSWAPCILPSEWMHLSSAH